MTDDGWDLIFEFAETFDEWTPPEVTARDPGAPASVPGDRPGDDYNRRARWEDVIGPHGWVPVGGSGERTYWRRPGKDRGWSATTGHCRSALRGDLLYVFTSSAPPFEQDKAYSRFEAFALLSHGGDWSAAGKALADEGYGGRDVPLIARGAPLPVPIPRFPPPAGNGNRNPEPPAAGARNGESGVPIPLPAPTRESGNRNPEEAPRWPMPIPASRLRRLEANEKWLVHGWLSRGGFTLLAALAKAGKTTLLAHLLRAFEADGEFCGLKVKGCRVLYVSEEDEGTWAERRDDLGLKDHLEFIPRPCRGRLTLPEWRSFLAHLARLCGDRHFDLVVFDTISKMWPVRDENEAPAVENALMPMYALTDTGAAVLIAHHMNKAGGQTGGGQFTAARGSGALPAFVETILELRRFEAANLKDPRRLVTGSGRYRETPQEMVLELTAAGYEARGDAHDVRTNEMIDAIRELLPRVGPGKPQKEIMEEVKGRDEDKAAVLRQGAQAGWWRREGAGQSKKPYTYWRPYTEEEERTARRAPLGDVLLFLKNRGPSPLPSIAAGTRYSETAAAALIEQLLGEGLVVAFESEAGSMYQLREDES